MQFGVRTLLVALLIGAPLAAQSGGPPPPHKPPQGPPPPPPEAVDACAKLVEGDACKVTFRDRTIDGTCVRGPRTDDPLACFPSQSPGQGR